MACETTVTYSITVFPALVIACGSPPAGMVGASYTHTFPASGGIPPYVFSISAGSVPPGLTLNASTGTLSGTPTLGGTFTFTVQVLDSLGNFIAQAQCSIFIAGSTCEGGARDDVHPYTATYAFVHG